MKIAITLLALLLMSSNSQAASYVACGAGEPSEEMPFFAKPEIQISSEDDLYSGIVGETWEMKYKNQPDWLASNGKVTAKTTREVTGEVVVTINIVQSQGIGPVGVKYVLTDLYSDEPRLASYAIGGFAGGSKTGEYSCVSVLD